MPDPETVGPLGPIPAGEGLLAHLVGSVRPDLAERIRLTGRVETAIVGLGAQGTRHAGLMRDFGTVIVGGVAPERGGERIAETIPVYERVADLLAGHPDLAAVSIWRHFSSARDAALESIEAGVPVVVLITEGIPLRDVRDILAAARRRGTLLIGGNTPGIIFPPERIRIGMLPDVFHPEEVAPGQAGPRGVTILSRSGAILYHLSDALASAGIAQNGVIGIGGDGAIGATFRQMVPLVMRHAPTDLVVVAGEVGGAQEEQLAADFRAHPERYPKPLVALLSGARAPAGKQMGHAGAIVSPGQDFGTFESKRAALAAACIPVVNSQTDLVDTVRRALGGRTGFEPERYYARMRTVWEAPAPAASWSTRITFVAPNRLVIAGIPLPTLVAEYGLVEAAFLLTELDLPAPETTEALREEALAAAAAPAPPLPHRPGEQFSTALARFLLLDPHLAEPAPSDARRTVRALGRTARGLAALLGHEDLLAGAATFPEAVALAAGLADGPPARVRLIEALAVASVDHGITPPSAQASILAATVRAPYPMALASGVGAITDVHGGAGEEAAHFFLACLARAEADRVPPEEGARRLLTESARSGRRVAGLGHRVHTRDPRRDVLLALAEAAGAAGPCIALLRVVEDIFEETRGFRLPVNVDGVIGAIAADLGLPAVAAKALFILGRVAGLSAHYFEEIATQSPMRRVRFEAAAYRGKLAEDY
jgi:succinyl-CoA synthetase alpha subunit